MTGVVGSNNAHNVRLVQGSHIVVKKKFDDPRAYFFQNTDGRIIFAIPYEQDFTLIGTTDQDYHGNPAEVKISDAEIDYLCAAASEYFVEPVKRDHVVWTYSGVRPLYDDGASKAQEATRDYVLKTDAPHGQAPLLNIFGGKITTFGACRNICWKRSKTSLASAASLGPPLEHCRAAILRPPPLMRSCRSSKSIIHFSTHAMRIACSGSTVRKAGHCSGKPHLIDDLGRHFGSDLYEAEVRYQIDHEWAVTAQDVLWRRTKKGLHLNADEAAALDRFMENAVDRRRKLAAE